MQIGLIGSIGPAATDYYYRRLIAEFVAGKQALELTIVQATKVDAIVRYATS